MARRIVPMQAAFFDDLTQACRRLGAGDIALTGLVAVAGSAPARRSKATRGCENGQTEGA